MRSKTAILSILTFLTLSLSYAQGIRFYQINDLNDYGQVLDMSIKENRLMLLVIFRDNGVFEEMIREGVFRDDSLESYFAELIPVAVYRESEMAERLIESFGKNALPTFLLMNSEEFLLNAAYGKQTENDLINFLVASKQLGEELEELKSSYKKNKLTEMQWVKLIGLYELNLDYLSTQSLAYEFLSAVPDNKLLNDTIKPVSLSYGISLEAPYAESILARKSQLDSAEFADFYSGAYSFNLDLAVENMDTVLLQKVLENLIPQSNAADSVKEEMVMETQILFAQETGLFNLWQKAVLHYSEGIDEPKEKAELAFMAAFEIADEYNSESAQDAARALAAKASTWHPDYRFYMLESYMAYLSQDYDEALKVIEQALALAESATDTEKAEQLKNIIVSDKGIE